jgi:UDP-N-acetylenolpyruvoylglucosamine reductase
MNLNFELEKKFEKELNKDINLSNYSWFNLGGNAEYFFKAKNKNYLKEFLK